MERIIYLFGLIGIGYIIYLAYLSYQNRELREFKRNALLTLILAGTQPLTKLSNSWKTDDNVTIYFLLSNIISLTDWHFKDKYDHCKAFVKQSTLEIKRLISTTEGKSLVVDKIDKYKSYLEQELKSNQLIDLKLRENKLKYLSDLKILFSQSKNITESVFLKFLMAKYQIDEERAKVLVGILSDAASGLIYYYNDVFQLNVNASGGSNSELEKKIFRAANELAVLSQIDLNQV